MDISSSSTPPSSLSSPPSLPTPTEQTPHHPNAPHISSLPGDSLEDRPQESLPAIWSSFVDDWNNDPDPGDQPSIEPPEEDQPPPNTDPEPQPSAPSIPSSDTPSTIIAPTTTSTTTTTTTTMVTPRPSMGDDSSPLTFNNFRQSRDDFYQAIPIDPDITLSYIFHANLRASNHKNIQLVSAVWYYGDNGHDPGPDNDEPENVVAHWSLQDKSNGKDSSPENSMRVKLVGRQTDGSSMDEPNTNDVLLQYDRNDNIIDEIFWWKLTWKYGDDTSWTSSPPFVLFDSRGALDDETARNVALQRLRERVPEYLRTTNHTSPIPQGIQNAMEGISNLDPSGTDSSGPSPTESLTTTTPTGTGINLDGGAGSIGNGDSSGGGGLSTGAIIGIAVGAGVAGLLLIAGLVWFFCRRRRSGKAAGQGGSYAAGTNGQYGSTKETHANITESPGSPYSEDGTFPPPQPRSQSNHTREGAPLVGAGAAAGETTPRSQASHLAGPDYTDVPLRSTADSRAGARSATPNVSHLIEDGMTEDEIRRLEDEERALDDAIERAAGGRRPA